MTAHTRSTRWRTLELFRLVWGVALLARPGDVLRRVHDLRVDQRSLVVARVLGARHIVQAVLSGVRPSPEVLAMGAWVDVAHASTAFAFAATDRERARAGLIDGTLALGWGYGGVHDLGRAAATAPRHQRGRDRLARLVLARVPGGRWLLARGRQT